MVTLNGADSALKSFYLDAVKESLDVKANPFFAQIVLIFPKNILTLLL